MFATTRTSPAGRLFLQLSGHHVSQGPGFKNTLCRAIVPCTGFMIRTIYYCFFKGVFIRIIYSLSLQSDSALYRVQGLGFRVQGLGFRLENTLGRVIVPV
jgi:hypothetical protein